MYASIEMLGNLYYVVVNNHEVVGVYEELEHAQSHAHGLNMVI